MQIGRRSSVRKIHDFSDRLPDSLHERRIEARQRATEEPLVVDRAKLIDEQIGIIAEPVGPLHTDSEWFCVFCEICRERNDESGRVARVDQRLTLNDENRTGFAGLSSSTRIEVGEPDLATLHSGVDSIRANSALTRRLSDRTFLDAAAIRSARIRDSTLRF